MREKLKAGYYLLQKILGRERRLLAHIKAERLVTVLNLHQVSPRANAFWPPLEPRLFDDLLGYLKDHFEIVTFGELDATDGTLPRAVLSFDDGYYNFVEYAAPLLDKHGLRANMNVIPSCVETGEPIWNVRLYDFLDAAPKALIDELRLPGFEARLAGDDASSKARYGLAISRFLKNRPRGERAALLTEIEPIMARLDFVPTRMMNAEEVLEMAVAGHEIGVHSYSHESMEFEDERFFADDLEKCCRFFAERLRLPLDIYAFPNGSCRAEQIEFLKKEGFAHVLLVGEDYARPPFRVCPRFTIYGASRLETRFQGLGINRR